MSKGKWKRRRNATKKLAEEVARQSALDSHLEIIQRYIDGIIDLKYWKRRKVCRAIMKKRNPFGGKNK